MRGSAGHRDSDRGWAAMVRKSAVHMPPTRASCHGRLELARYRGQLSDPK